MNNEEVFSLIETNNLNELISINPNLDELIFNPLLEAVINKSWDVAAYIISHTNKYTNIPDHSGHTVLVYALKAEKYDFAMMLLDSGFNNFSQRNYQGKLVLDFINNTNSITHEILSRILAKSSYKKGKHKDFRIYENEELELRSLGKSGSYGTIYYDIKGDNVVKISSGANTLHSFMREAMLLRMINIINPDLVVTLKGVNVTSNEISLILEGLSYSLDDVFKLYTNIDIISKRDYYKDIFYTLLNNIDKLHSMGILHRDLKPNNIMLTVDGHLKIIDLGLAEYVGIMPTKIDFIGTTGYVAPDSNIFNKFKLPNDEIILLPNNERNYSSDVYSIASIIVYSIYGKHISLYFHNNDIYFHNAKPENGIVNLNKMNDRDIDKLNNFSTHLIDLLKSMFELDSNLRITARDTLKHKFFSGALANGKTLIDQRIIDNNDCIFNLNSTISRISNQFFTDDEIRFNRGPLKYGEDIYEFIRNSTIPATNIPSDVLKSKIEDIYVEFDASVASSKELKEFDSMFNRNMFISSVTDQTNEYLFDLFFHSLSTLKSKMKMSTIKLSFEETIKSMNNIYPISISSLIEYYITRMQRDNIPSSIISYFRFLAYNQFYELSYTERKNPVSVEKLIFEIIKEVSVNKDIHLPLI